ncbi:hypothetical protein OJAV_G00024970 [Oryzias javanicus]|uniref:non-specific serine/threonine protein kinase n=1 Tax=Oryzias javanicus TaxID=123683 RepID=A0A3S2UNF8_ORYJA|nr:hypothetical protein OJAV_G00024970 [Oryzias javanicus]
MAHLAEETQPSFVTTLKSKAVSENCNVKFSCVVTGYPAPQVTWYKDDTQLDRLCGLPKYEVFHNGQNHSLQIYNCTVEDAAIYQASAINSKGIVSCSGVLEVGEMNEFKIHQKYFAKLKQKSGSRQQETDGKENQEPIRTISPDRTQRKRRSTMEAFLNTPSSTEDEITEESRVSVDAKAEERLQEPTVEEPEMKPAASPNRTVSAVTAGQFNNSDTGNKSGTYIYDPVDKIFTPHQTKTPSVKKKIKISSSEKVGEEDAGATSDRWPKDAKNSSAVTICKETAPTNGTSEEVMEVENKASSSVVESDLQNKNEEQRKKEEVPSKISMKDDNPCIELSSEKKDVVTAGLTFPSHIISGSEGEQLLIENRCKDNKEHSKMNNQIPSTKKRSTVKSTLLSKTSLKENRTENIKMKETDVKTEKSSGQIFERISSESMETSCSNENLLQRPCEPTRTLMSEKETSSSQEMQSVSLPAVPSEVIQTYTKRNRNDAALKPKLPPDKCTVGSPLQQKTSTLGSDPHGTTDKMARESNTSIKSSQNFPAVLTLKKKLPQASKGCVLPVSKQNDADRPVQTVKGKEVQDQEEAGVNEVDKLLIRTKDLASDEKMETEVVGLVMIEQTNEEKTGNGDHKDSTKTDMKKENNCSNIRNSKSNVHENMHETAHQGMAKTPANTDLSKENVDFNEIQKPVTKVISIAELLRSQIKALDLASTVSSIQVHSNLGPDPGTTATAVGKELKNDKEKLKAVKPDSDTKPSPEVAATKTIKETLMEIYQQVIETEQKQIPTSSEASTVQPMHTPDHTPIVTGGDANDEQVNRNSREHNEEAMDTSKERDASPTKTISPDRAPLLDSSKELLNIQKDVSNVSETVIPESGSPLIQAPVESSIQETNATILKHLVGEPVQVQRKETHTLIPEIRVNSKKEEEVTQISSSSTCKMEEHATHTVSVQAVKMSPTGGDFDNLTQVKDQQESSLVDKSFRSDSSVEAPEQSPRLKRSDDISVTPSATPQELASGARRKVPAPKSKPEGPTDGELQKKEAVPTKSLTQSSSPTLSRRSPLLQPTLEQTSTAERQSPLLTRRKTPSENQPVIDKSNTNDGHVDKHSPFKAPQVIRKIRSEMFADASGHLKLWCQFFNILSDSAVKWFKNEEEITQVTRKAGDESQVNLAIVQASRKDAGVYGCSITNEYGTASTDLLLSADILAGMFLREDLGVGEEIEMTPLIFNKGLADSGIWGNKFFGRIMMTESHIGDGCSHKAWRAKVIYGLEPVFESGNTCIIKIRSPVTYEGREESCLLEKNLDLMKQECKMQNLAREYSKIFSTEARTIESFGPCLEVIPVYLMFRPANVVPYATVEMDLTGVYQKYSSLDHKGRLDMRTGSAVEQKCCAFQHWMFQWTNGNLLLTRLEGVDTKITNVRISVKSTGYQGLPVEGNPQMFEQFVSQHKCNYFCGLLGLRSLKVLESLTTPTRAKGSRSPLLQRRMTASPSSPQNSRKATGSPRLSRKVEQDGYKTPAQQNAADPPKSDLLDIK